MALPQWQANLVNAVTSKPLLCVGGPLDRQRYYYPLPPGQLSFNYVRPTKPQVLFTKRLSSRVDATLTVHSYLLDRIGPIEFYRHGSLSYQQAIDRIFNRYEKKSRKKNLLAEKVKWIDQKLAGMRMTRMYLDNPYDAKQNPIVSGSVP